MLEQCLALLDLDAQKESALVYGTDKLSNLSELQAGKVHEVTLREKESDWQHWEALKCQQPKHFGEGMSSNTLKHTVCIRPQNPKVAKGHSFHAEVNLVLS